MDTADFVLLRWKLNGQTVPDSASLSDNSSTEDNASRRWSFDETEPSSPSIDECCNNHGLYENKSSSSGKCLSWGTISIRYHSTIPGDHPDTQIGPPLSIGWEVLEEETFDLKDPDEDAKIVHKTKQELVLSSSTRRAILRKLKANDDEIAACIRAAQLVSRNRIRSRKDKIEENDDQE